MTTTPSALQLTGLHARYQFTETIRIPIAVVGTAAFPALSMLFFVVPVPYAQDPQSATAATAQLAVFAVMSVCLFSYGVGVAEDRARPWDGYLRTLPTGAGPRLVGRLLNGLAFALVGLAPLVVIAWLFTAATLPVERVPVSVLALAAAGAPLFGAGIAIGYTLSSKAALAVAQLLLLPLAFGGGLILPPEIFPEWFEAISVWLPTRAGRDLVVGATTAETVSLGTVGILLGWSLVAGALAVWAYRRDEGLRYR